jgi:hypothetical protein
MICARSCLGECSMPSATTASDTVLPLRGSVTDDRRIIPSLWLNIEEQCRRHVDLAFVLVITSRFFETNISGCIRTGRIVALSKHLYLELRSSSFIL